MFCPRCHRSFEDPSDGRCPDDGTVLTADGRLGHIRARPTRQIGAILDGRYQLKGLVGKGGMARVYLAEDIRTKEPVAVKILNRDIARDRVSRERFLREIEVAASIGHPNVVQVFDAGERPDGAPFIVLEFLHGESLGDLLRRDDAVEPAFGVPMIAKAASALAAAHRAGIIHRDVKPDNLFLVGERGAPYTLKVVDFGMAKLQEVSNLSQTGMTLGTLAYIAPEQALADPIDARTDIYGLGVVMYRMLTGQLPFNPADDAMLVAQHLFVPPLRPSAVRPGLDPRIEAVIMTALRKRPENRYPTMAALAEDLERILGERPGEVREGPIRAAPDLYQAVRPNAVAAADVLRTLVGR
ncbi:MAG: serine/threonine-protein kinase [Minicystis sp.]